MLFTTPQLTARDLEVVAKIDAAKSDLKGLLHVPRRWTGLLRRSTIGRAIRGSNSIEGYRVAKEDAVAAAAGETLDANEETRRAIAAYQRAMTYALHVVGDPSFQYSEVLIKSLHFMMLEYDLDKNPGKWRPGAIYVFDEDRNQQVYEGPDAATVPALMHELVERIANEDANVPNVVRAAMAHLNLAMIHPFSDGNGRMARCLQTLVLGRGGVLEPAFSSVEEYLGEHHREYYDVLTEVGQGSWHPENDAGWWIRFSLRAHFYQANTLLRRVHESERLYAVLEQEVRRAGLPERSVLALFDAAGGFRVRNGTYRTVADISEQVASRDLRLMVDAGLLEAQGEKRARSYVASQNLASLKRGIMEAAPIADPYGGVELRASATLTTSARAVVIAPVAPSSSTAPAQHPARFRPGERR